MRTIAIVNQKGGVAKTTTALALSVGLGLHKGTKILIMDLDSQGNLSASVPAESKTGFSVADVLNKSVALFPSILKEGERAKVIPSAPSLSAADMTMNQTGKEYRLKEALSSLGNTFDFCVIDTPPTLGILTINALTAADGIIIPAQADYFSLHGISQLGDTIATVRRYCNPLLKVYGILLTRWNGRTIISKDVSDLLEEAAKKLGTRLFDSRIRECTAIKESQAALESIYKYAPRSNGAADYTQFLAEFIKTLKT